MKNNKTVIFALLAVVSLATACRKDDDLTDVSSIPGLGGDSWVQNEYDKYIYDSLTVPYNITVYYKWNQLALGQVDKNVVPVKEEIIKPVIDAMKRVWSSNYISEFGEAMFHKYSPKFFTFVGSAAYNLDGTALLGVAGSGREITLFQLNYFRNKTMPGYVLADTLIQKNTFHTIEHEYAHIFDQTKLRPYEFDQVCRGYYSADWTFQTDEQAYSEGFISPYASSQPGEDFAEMIAFMLVEGPVGFEKMINSITGVSVRGTTAEMAKARLRQKRDILVSYFSQTWNIDLLRLQAKTRESINKEFY